MASASACGVRSSGVSDGQRITLTRIAQQLLLRRGSVAPDRGIVVLIMLATPPVRCARRGCRRVPPAMSSTALPCGVQLRGVDARRRGYAGAGDTRFVASIHFITMLANTLNGAGLFLNALPMRAQLAGTGCASVSAASCGCAFLAPSCAACSACCRACNSRY